MNRVGGAGKGHVIFKKMLPAADGAGWGGGYGDGERGSGDIITVRSTVRYSDFREWGMPGGGFLSYNSHVCISFRCPFPTNVPPLRRKSTSAMISGVAEAR